MYLKHLFFITIISFLLSTCIARADTKCPPASLILEKAHFINAHIFLEKPFWILWTNNFQYNGKEWNLTFTTRLSASKETKALVEGQQFFNTKVQLMNPENSDEEREVSCGYSDNDIYAVGAFSPPWPN